jgi:hypothetical protein
MERDLSENFLDARKSFVEAKIETQVLSSLKSKFFLLMPMEINKI